MSSRSEKASRPRRRLPTALIGCLVILLLALPGVASARSGLCPSENPQPPEPPPTFTPVQLDPVPVDGSGTLNLGEGGETKTKVITLVAATPLQSCPSAVLSELQTADGIPFGARVEPTVKMPDGRTVT